MSTIVSEFSTLPPVNCAPWCEDGDGHPTATHPEDQYCTTAASGVGLTRHGLVRLDTGNGEHEWRQNDLRAYLMRERYAAEPHISLARGDLAEGELTIEEAETFANNLLRLVEMARA